MRRLRFPLTTQLLSVCSGLLLLLISYSNAWGMLGEQTVETSEPPKVMLIAHDTKLGTLSLQPLSSMASTTKLDHRVMTFLASVSPQTLTTTGGIPSIASVRQGIATLKQQPDGFLGKDTMESKYPLLFNTLTYLSRKQTTLHKYGTQQSKQVSDPEFKPSAVNYAETLKTFAVTEQWLDAVESWLEDKIGNEHSAVYPAEGKQCDDYVDWIKQTTADLAQTHPHLKLQRYLQVKFMSLMIQIVCLVTDEDQLDDLLSHLHDKKWEASLYGLCDLSGQWTFNKAMCQFAF